MQSPEQADAGAIELLREHDRLWGELDLAGVAALWDELEPQPIYLGEEYAGPIVGWPDLNRHWGRLASRLKAATMRSTVIAADDVVPGLIRCVALIEWELVGVESAVPRTGRSWVTILLRQRAGGWRILHYMEASVYFADQGG